MFIGHYAVCFAIKHYEKKTSLGRLFIAVQLLDLVFFTLVVAGVEKFSLQEHYLAASHIKAGYFPWSHSLFAAVLWSITTYCIFMYMLPVRGSKANRVALLMAVAVFSHWLLDYCVYVADLPVLGGNSLKLGLGIWSDSVFIGLLEVSLLLAAFFIYIKKTRIRRKKGRHALLVLVVVMMILGLVNTFGPLFSSATTTFSMGAIIIFLGLAWLAMRFEQYRA
ncbi:hypothetical protein MNBD_GAMMA12-412 [hydrothermal vent metagenome]|uniref:Uncharacterized protein n=1 Tax=hydrothermal vent metagenome TaxID=652676 RepID=A0A3B0YY98_9ZZZZ